MMMIILRSGQDRYNEGQVGDDSQEESDDLDEEFVGVDEEDDKIWYV
jgi:hypothetical protein